MGPLVKRNKNSVSRINQVRQLNSFCNYIHKENVIKQIREKNENQLDPEFLTDKFKINKWKDFKEKRLDAIKKFIDIKRDY